MAANPSLNAQQRDLAELIANYQWEMMITLTYPSGFLYREDHARTRLAAWMNAVSTIVKGRRYYKRGAYVQFFIVTEQEGRPHHHALLRCTGDADPERFLLAWDRISGSQSRPEALIYPLQSNMGVCTYVCKECDDSTLIVANVEQWPLPGAIE